MSSNFYISKIICLKQIYMVVVITLFGWVAVKIARGDEKHKDTFAQDIFS